VLQRRFDSRSWVHFMKIRSSESSCSNDVSVQGLLITGRAGSGKTSVAQATAKSLQWDPDVHACMSLSTARGVSLTTPCSHVLR
jgi:ATP-dependent protease Clp ATPase subunit